MKCKERTLLLDMMSMKLSLHVLKLYKNNYHLLIQNIQENWQGTLGQPTFSNDGLRTSPWHITPILWEETSPNDAFNIDYSWIPTLSNY